MGSGFRAPENPSKAAGPREPGQPSPGSPLGERGSGGENGLRCFLDPRRVVAVVCCPRRVSLCRMQLPELFSGHRCDAASALSGRAGSGGMAGARAQKASGAQSCFPTKENPWGVGFRHRRPPAKQQGPGSRGSPTPVRPMESGGRGPKRLALLSPSEARWGCGLLPEESFPLQNAAARRLFGAVGAKGPRR